MADSLQSNTSFAELLCALSLAADLNMGQPMEHGLKTAYVGLRLVEAFQLPREDEIAVYYGALLKDVG